MRVQPGTPDCSPAELPTSLGDARTQRWLRRTVQSETPVPPKVGFETDDPKRQRMVEKSSLPDEAKMHPPQASEKRREFELPEVSFLVNIKCLIRGGTRWIRTRDISNRTA